MQVHSVHSSQQRSCLVHNNEVSDLVLRSSDIIFNMTARSVLRPHIEIRLRDLDTITFPLVFWHSAPAPSSMIHWDTWVRSLWASRGFSSIYISLLQCFFDDSFVSRYVIVFLPLFIHGWVTFQDNFAMWSFPRTFCTFFHSLSSHHESWMWCSVFHDVRSPNNSKQGSVHLMKTVRNHASHL
jgi:hypothetical protein